MRVFASTAFLFCFVGLSFGQLQLANNPACPNNAPYCRATITTLPNPNGTAPTPWVIGGSGNVVWSYTWVLANQACPLTSTVNSTPALCFYTSTNFMPETWTFVGQVLTTVTEGVEGIAFPPSGGCSTYKYVWTASGRILRIHSDWSFDDVGGPSTPGGPSNLPYFAADAVGFYAGFAAANQGSTTALFFSKYRNHSCDPPSSCTPPLPITPAVIWFSEDCGNTWTNSRPEPPVDPNKTYSFGCDEVHAIAVDPANSMNVYANIDCENTPNNNAPLGLWKSVDGGQTFSQVSNGNANNPPITQGGSVGLDFAFPASTNKLFMEGDGTVSSTTGGQLLSWDKVNGGNMQIPDFWPLVPPGQIQWSTGYSIGLKLTSDQNLFVNTGAFAPRQGMWYFAPPFYDAAVLLEDLAVPISSITVNNDGTATVETAEPYVFEPGDSVAISGVTPWAFDQQYCSPSTVPPCLTVQDSTHFKYNCPGCSGTPTLSGALATKFNYFLFRTVEVTGPSPNYTKYLYNTEMVFAEPHFVLPSLPVSGSALTSFVDTDGGQHWAYVGQNQHVYDVFWYSQSNCTQNNTACGIGFTDLTCSSTGLPPHCTSGGAPLAATGSALATYQVGSQLQWYFIDVNNHVDHVLCGLASTSCWWADMTAATGTPAATAPSPLTAFADSAEGSYWAFVGPNQHIYEGYWTGGYGSVDLTAAAGAPVTATGGPLTSYQVGSQLQWYFLDNSNHVDHIICSTSSTSCVSADLTAAAGTPAATAGSALTAFADSAEGSHWAFVGPNQHVYEGYWTGGYGSVDLTAAAGAPAAATGSALSSYQVGSQLQWYFRDANNHVDHIICATNSTSCGLEDLTTSTGGPVTTAGSALTTFVDPAAGSHCAYLGANQHLYEVFWTGGYGFADLDSR